MRWSWLALPAFPLASHFAATQPSSLLASIAMALLALPWLIDVRGALGARAIALRAGVLVLLAFSPWLEVSLAMLELIPVLLPFGLMLLFARSLRPGEVSWVTRLAERLDGPLSAKALRYTRTVTKVWVAVFAALGLQGMGLAMGASAETWSLFTNGINYILLASVFLVEFMVRQHVLRGETRHDFATFVRRLGEMRLAGAQEKRE